MNWLKQNQKIAYKAARDGGLSDQAAKVIAANFSGESLARPSLRTWDIKQYSQGIAQWSQFRADRIKAHFGKFPKDMSVAEQIAVFLWECKRFYPKTWKALTTLNITALEQMTMIVRDFERPRYPSRDIRRRMIHFASLGNLGEAYGAVNGEKHKPS
jgi:hypothetical protein